MKLAMAKKDQGKGDGDGAAPKAAKKRWLAGRGSMKRRKLDQNKRLLDWLKQNEVWVTDEVDWGQTPSPMSVAVETREQIENEASGRGVVAARDIAQYEELARVPEGITMSKASSIAVFGEDAVGGINMYQATGLHLMHERWVEGENSFWKPYIDVLPTAEEVGGSWTWSDEDLHKFLEGSPLESMSLFFRQKIQEEYATLKKTIFAKYPEKFPLEVFTYERWVWAYSILLSRAVRLKFDDETDWKIALVPYIDLLNHSPFAETFITGIR